MSKTNFILLAALLTACASKEATTLVEPLQPQNSVIELRNVTIPAHFTRSDFDWERQTLTLQPFSMDLYSSEAIRRMKPGDRFLFDSDTLTVETVEFDGDYVLVNKGIEEGGADLRQEENGCYRGVIWDDYATFTPLDAVTLPLSDTWTLTDCGENPTDPSIEVTADHQTYLDALPDYNEQFSPLNTLVEIQNGQIVSIARRWIP